MSHGNSRVRVTIINGYIFRGFSIFRILILVLLSLLIKYSGRKVSEYYQIKYPLNSYFLLFSPCIRL